MSDRLDQVSKLPIHPSLPSIVVSPAAFGNGSDLGDALVGIDRVSVCRPAAGGAGEKICVSEKDKRKLPKPTKRVLGILRNSCDSLLI